MKFAVIAILFIMSSQSYAGALSYKDWKGRRIDEAKSTISQLKLDKNVDTSERSLRMTKAESKLQAAKDLTANDYFHLYVMENLKSKPEELRTVVSKLSKDELSEILKGYIKQTQLMNGLKTGPNNLDPIRVTGNP